MAFRIDAHDIRRYLTVFTAASFGSVNYSVDLGKVIIVVVRVYKKKFFFAILTDIRVWTFNVVMLQNSVASRYIAITLAIYVPPIFLFFCAGRGLS